MGCNARLYASGPYSKEIASHLDYPADFYGDVDKGTPIFTHVCTMETNDSSRKLAEAFGIELFPGVVISPKKVLGHLNDLWAFVEDLDNYSFTITNYGTIKHLAEAGFTFYFDPIG